MITSYYRSWIQLYSRHAWHPSCPAVHFIKAIWWMKGWVDLCEGSRSWSWMRGGLLVSVLDCKSWGLVFKSQPGQTFEPRFLLHLCPLTNSVMMTLIVHCQWEDEMVKEGTGHPPSYDEAKKRMLLTLHTHGCPRASLWLASSSSSYQWDKRPALCHPKLLRWSSWLMHPCMNVCIIECTLRTLQRQCSTTTCQIWNGAL